MNQLWALVVTCFFFLVGCSTTSGASYGGAFADSGTEPADADTDTDSDTDADADGDTDTDTDADTDTGVTDPDADGDGYTVGEGDCNDGDASIYPGATDIQNDGIDQDCDGSDWIVEEEYDLNVTIGTPSGTEVATMFVHFDFVTDLEAEEDNWNAWEWDGRYAWTTSETFGFNPGDLEALRFNVTYCSLETEDENDASCTNWLAYGRSESEARLNAEVSGNYDGDTFTSVDGSVTTVTFCWWLDESHTDYDCGSSAIAYF